MSLEESFASMSLGDDIVIVDPVVPKTEPPITGQKKSRSSNKKRATKSKPTDQDVKVEKGNEEEEEDDELNNLPDFFPVSADPTLLGKIIERIEHAVQRLHRDNEVEVELKFGRMIGRNSEARYWGKSKTRRPKIIHKLAFGHFDSDIGLHYIRQVTRAVEKKLGAVAKEERSKETYYLKGKHMGIVRQEGKPEESFYSKRIIHDFYVFNPTGQFDFKITISEKVERTDEEKKVFKRDGRRVFRRSKSKRVWLEGRDQYITNQVKISPAVRNQLYEFEMKLDLKHILRIVRDEKKGPPNYDYELKIVNFLFSADTINEEIK
ncbi:hypothetical protein Cantr_09025 [Candida viswanathii]|uniref:mRNA 5'-phosphatase n=1 Tax=Candida viswanathii TaxID=5486 RepID=A0A367Y9W9_9ASCO|nr:hypothetical protein Cantr_09025 [Candida viswanathii]